MCKRVPLNPTAMDAAAITAGPVMNLTPAAKVAAEFPHAMIFGCNAIKRPTFRSIELAQLLCARVKKKTIATPIYRKNVATKGT